VAYSYVRYPGNGSTTNYTFSFPYISTTHIKVRVNGTIVTNWSFLNSSTIQFAAAPAAAAVIEIRRETPKESVIVNFNDASVLLERDLDLSATWQLYVAQETDDDLEDTLRTDSLGRLDANNKRIVNVADPVDPQDAVTKAYADVPKLAAEASATSAANSAAAAAASYDSFDDRYLGSKAVAPSVDNDGNALLVGAVYWDTVSSQMFSWDGSLWKPTFLTGNAVRALVVATAAQTVVTVPTYLIGVNTLQVFVNGVKVLVGADYTETTQNSITFVSGLTLGDEVEVIALQAYAVGSTSSDLVSYLPSGTGATTSNTQTKLRESVSVKDFGAVGDNVANDLSAFTAARDAGKAYFVPSGTYKLDTAFNSGNTPVINTGGTINAVDPNNTFFKSSIDLGKKTIFRTSIRDSGEYSGTPTTYTYLKDLVSLNIRHINGAGYQQFYSSDTGGRTSVPAIYIEMDHIGYGDCPGVSTHIGVQRHPNFASATLWTGMNSGVLYDGSVAAVTPNCNVYGAEWVLSDNGNDRVAANGLVLNFFRENGNASNSGAYNTVWSGVRATSLGTYAADTAFYVGGKWNVGLDFSAATLSNNAAIALKTNDRIYFGIPGGTPSAKWYADTLSTNYQVFDGGKYNFVVSNFVALTVAQSEIVSIPVHKFVGSFNVTSAGNIASTVGAAGGAAALPATPFTYLRIQIDGASYKIPVYNN
jgi:hypothetical protein